MANIYLIIKYVFLGATVLSAGFLIEHLTVIEHLSAPEKLVEEPLIYNASAPLLFRNRAASFLKEDYLKCILEPSTPFCLIPLDKRQKLFRRDNETDSLNPETIRSRLKNMTSDLQEYKKLMPNLIVDFIRIMESADVDAVLIEPSILFCMLTLSEKNHLLAMGFHPGRHLGSRNIVTFAVFEKDSEKLREGNVTNALLSAGFEITSFKKLKKSLGSTEDESEEKSFKTFRYFLTRQNTTVHVVVLNRRYSYLWHNGLDTDEVDFEGLLFVDEQAFESFPLFPLNTTAIKIKQTLIPYNVRHFLQEVESSRFVECQGKASKILPVYEPSSLTMEQSRAAIALRELKIALVPHAVVFWLWSRTLLGWREKCNILQYSPTLELSLTLKSIEGLNLTQLFTDGEFLYVQHNENMDMDFEFHLKCLGLLVKIYIMYDDRNEFWYKYYDGQNVYRLTYPKIDLCSTDIWGQKVNVPCKDDFLSQEKKQNWSYTEVSSPPAESEFSPFGTLGN